MVLLKADRMTAHDHTVWTTVDHTNYDLQVLISTLP